MNAETETNERADKQRLRSASNSKLPLASAIPDTETMKRAVALLEEGVRLKSKISESQERLDEIETELYAVAAIYDLSGFRYGLAGFEKRGYVTRSRLDKQKLVSELSSRGIPASLIDACYVSGEPYLDTRITVFDIE